MASILWFAETELALAHDRVYIVDERYRVDRERDRPLGLGSYEREKAGRLTADDDVSVIGATEFAVQCLAFVDPTDEAGLMDIFQGALTPARIHQIAQLALLQTDPAGQGQIQLWRAC